MNRSRFWVQSGRLAPWLGALLLACGSTQQTPGAAGGSDGAADAGGGGSSAGKSSNNSAGSGATTARGGDAGAGAAQGGGGSSGGAATGNAGNAGNAGATLCDSACTLNDATACQDGKQTVCVESAGCPVMRTVDCRCFEVGDCLSALHQEWGDRSNSNASGVAFDSSGHVLTAASTIGQLTPLNMAAAGGRDVLVKWSPSLDLTWALQLGTAVSGIARAVTIDADDNAYLAAAVSPDDEIGGPDVLDIMLTKVDPTGKELWTKTFGSSLYDDASELTTDAHGNVYVAGFASAAVDTETALGKADALLVKLTADGDRVWARQFGSQFGDYARGLCVDAAGDVYVTGAVSGNVDGDTDLFVTKFSAAGEQLWNARVGSSLIDGGTGIACGQDAVYVVGITAGRLDDPQASAPAETDLVVLSYDLDGNQRWLAQWLTAGEERYSKIAIGPDGNLLISGGSSSNLDQPTQLRSGSTDLFLSEWSEGGAPRWSYQWGSDSWDSATSIAIAKDGRIAVGAGVQAGLPGFTAAGDGDAVVSVFTRRPAP